jgi:hypothetical protein
MPSEKPWNITWPNLKKRAGFRVSPTLQPAPRNPLPSQGADPLTWLNLPAPAATAQRPCRLVRNAAAPSPMRADVCYATIAATQNVKPHLTAHEKKPRLIRGFFNFRGSIGVDVYPVIKGMVAKPGQLAFGKITGILLDQGQHLILCQFTLQKSEDLLVANGL